MIGLARDPGASPFASQHQDLLHDATDWIYPTYTAYAEGSRDMVSGPAGDDPILKLFGAGAENRSQRLRFDVSSPNGILLFREASNIICMMGTGSWTFRWPQDQMYPSNWERHLHHLLFDAEGSALRLLCQLGVSG